MMDFKEFKKNLVRYKELLNEVNELYNVLCTQIKEIIKFLNPESKYEVMGMDWPYIVFYEERYDNEHLRKEPVLFEDILSEFVNGADEVVSTNFCLSPDEIKKLREAMHED